MPIADLPEELTDRAEDAWEPLIAVADAAGGDWPKLAREAAKILSAEAAEADAQQSEAIRLLADVREVFDRLPRSFVRTDELLTELRNAEDAPWGEREFTARALATRLAKFEIRSGRDTTGKHRGYRRADFADPFARYLASETSEASNTAPDLRKDSDGSESSDGFNPSDASDPSRRNRRSEPSSDGSDGSDGTPRADCGHPASARHTVTGKCGICTAKKANAQTTLVTIVTRCPVHGTELLPDRLCLDCAEGDTNVA